MMIAITIVARLLGALLELLLIASVRPRAGLAAENLFPRRQLALRRERSVKARRPVCITRVTPAYLAWVFDNWREASIIVKPRSLVGWHRAGFRLLWRWKSRPGRPAIPAELRRLIGQMAHDNPLWGPERIAIELLHKFGIRLSPRTPDTPRGDQRWRTFLHYHAKAIVACAFFWYA